MRTYWCSAHVDHDPGRLAAPAGSSSNYYSEVAQRGEVLLSALGDATLGAVIDVGRDPSDALLPAALDAVHDGELMELLRTVHARIAQEDGWAEPVASGAPGDTAVVAETFVSPGDPSPGRSTSAWAELGRRCADTSAPVFAGTWAAAAGAARSAAAAADDVIGGASIAFALCRPPGHHAGRGRFGGFCYLNNAAVAAQQLSSAGRRVAIVDVDIHHGNGTQDIFWDRPDVLYASLHIDPAIEYPYFAGFADEIGGPAAEGANLNVPLPAGCDADRYLGALDHVLAAVSAFGADALVISLGTDTHRDDPLGRFEFGTDDFPRLGAKLAKPDLPTVVVQEGGYHLPSLGPSVVGFLSAWA